MLLIDEIDRADEALEAVLLETARRVPGFGARDRHVHAPSTPPYVILTSNNTRDLSAALKRRCLHLFLDYPIGGARAGDRAVQEHRAARRAGRAARRHRARAARAGAAQGAEHLRDHRLGAHPRRARGRRADRAGALRHRLGGGQVRQGRPQGARGAARGWSTPTPRCLRTCHGHGHGHGHGHEHDHGTTRDDRRHGAWARQRPRPRARTCDGPDGRHVRRPRTGRGRFSRRVLRHRPGAADVRRTRPAHGSARRAALDGERPCTGSSGCCGCAACASRSPRRSTRCGAPAQPGVLADTERPAHRAAVALVKDRRDEPIFDEIFDPFFALVRVGGDGAGHGHGHAPRRPRRHGRARGVHAVRGAQRHPAAGPQHGKPADIRDYFNQEDLAQQYNLHQEANKIDLAALTDEIVLSKETDGSRRRELPRRSSRPTGCTARAPPGKLSPATGHAGRRRAHDRRAGGAARLAGRCRGPDADGDEDDAAALRRRLAGVLANLPRGAQAPPRGAAGAGEPDRRDARAARPPEVGPDRRARAGRAGGVAAPAGPRRCTARSTAPAPHRRARAGSTPAAPCGATCASTACRSCRSRSARAEDRPRLVVLADVSACRCARPRGSPCTWCTACRTCSPRCASFAFVARDRRDHRPVRRPPARARARADLRRRRARRGRQLRLRHRLRRVPRGARLGGDPAHHGARARRRRAATATTRTSAAFEEITRRARETIWLTPEPRYSWGLGSCDLPAYAEFCDRVRVVRDLTGLERAAHELAAEAVGR